MNHPKHEDKRGYFQELFRVSECGHEVRQVSRFKINPGQTRGGHYHTSTYETFIVLDGECVVHVYDINQEFPFSQHLGEGECLTMQPFSHHTFYSKDGCVLLVASNKEFDPKSTDTFPDLPKKDAR
jgi:dTDP-4-dehydrorhamnose 3,5-epimerase-like enzyme